MGWSGMGTCRESIVQSLWFRNLYRNGRKSLAGDNVWLEGFPPRMNRESFFQYAVMLFWDLLRAGSGPEARALINGLRSEYPHIKEFKKLAYGAKAEGRIYLDAMFWCERAAYETRALLKSIAYGMA